MAARRWFDVDSMWKESTARSAKGWLIIVVQLLRSNICGFPEPRHRQVSLLLGILTHCFLSRHSAKYSASSTCEITSEIFGTECGTSCGGSSHPFPLFFPFLFKREPSNAWSNTTSRKGSHGCRDFCRTPSRSTPQWCSVPLEHERTYLSIQQINATVSLYI